MRADRVQRGDHATREPKSLFDSCFRRFALAGVGDAVLDFVDKLRRCGQLSPREFDLLSEFVERRRVGGCARRFGDGLYFLEKSERRIRHLQPMVNLPEAGCQPFGFLRRVKTCCKSLASFLLRPILQLPQRLLKVVGGNRRRRETVVNFDAPPLNDNQRLIHSVEQARNRNSNTNADNPKKNDHDAAYDDTKTAQGNTDHAEQRFTSAHGQLQ